LGVQLTQSAQPTTVVYTHPDCAFSAAAKMDFRQRKVEYLEIDLSKEPDKIPELLEMTNGERITPVIVENGSVTLGFKGGY
jgi:glutaredoxin